MRTLLIAALLVGVAGARTHCQCNSDKPTVNSFPGVYTTVPPPTDCRKGFHLACYDEAPKVEPKPEAMGHKIGGQDSGIGDSGLSVDEIGPEGDGPPIWGILTTESPNPEATDVPAVDMPADSRTTYGGAYNDSIGCTNGGKLVDTGVMAFKCEGGHALGCTDKRRVLLTSEDGTKHCILFPTQEAK